MTVSLCFLCPLTAPSHPLSPTHENNVHQPGIEPGSHRWQHTTLEHTFRARQLDACAEDVMPPGTQDPLATLTTPYKSARHATWNSRSVGYPHHSLQVDTCGIRTTRGDPIGLAGRRLSRSAKVSSAKSASQLRSSPGSHVTVSLCFLCPPHRAISPALTDS